MFQWMKIILLVLRYGKLRHSGKDFNLERSNSVSHLLQNDIQPPIGTIKQNKIKSQLLKNSITRNLLAQGAFLKNSFRFRGRYLFAPALNLAYIRIPKSASTSISLSLLPFCDQRLKNRSLNSTEINFLTDIYLNHQLKEDNKSIEFFTVVRNPFARVVSVYRDFFEKSSGDFIYQDYLFGIFNRHISFPEFVHRLQSIPDRLKDQHLKPQHLFLKYYQEKINDIKIFKLEYPRAVDDFFSEFDLRLQHINSSKDPYDYRAYYDRKTFEAVIDIYDGDIQRFNYEKEAEMLKEFIKLATKHS